MSRTTLAELPFVACDPQKDKVSRYSVAYWDRAVCHFFFYICRCEWADRSKQNRSRPVRSVAPTYQSLFSRNKISRSKFTSRVHESANDPVKGEDVIMIPTRGNKHLMMLKGFTYSQANYSAYWYCSSKKKGCAASVRSLPSGEIIRVNSEHTHPPPRYVRHAGQYIKI
ncbi:hypothetical protein EVAR_17953_1 [Eumeta japonica]|uniref:FLYWCH-type domain-containing protein n=1 Tax=Eumeta variegata TaxID=151549 RepID=A0A4C1UY90_EUMVA|nr:hypothetical protein EVAR_17953_1 [Eumeta japonica]